MKIAAFDAKDFNRSKVVSIPNPSNPEEMQKKFKGFFSLLGVGVLIGLVAKFNLTLCQR